MDRLVHRVVFKTNVDCAQRLLRNFNERNPESLFNLEPLLNDRVVIYKHVGVIVFMVVASRTWEIDIGVPVLNVELTIPSHFKTISNFEKFIRENGLTLY